MDFIALNEKINRLSRIILHSDNEIEKIIYQKQLKKVRVQLKEAKNVQLKQN